MSEAKRAASFALELRGGRVLRLPESISAARLAELVLSIEASDLAREEVR